MLGRAWHAYTDSLANERNALVAAASGVSVAVSVAVTAQISSGETGAEIRMAFYQTVATVIPVLLLSFLLELRSAGSSIGAGIRDTQQFLAKQEECSDCESGELVKELRESLESGEHRIATGRSLGAFGASIAVFAEAMALYALATGATSSFLFVSALLGVVTTGMYVLMFLIYPLGMPRGVDP